MSFKALGNSGSPFQGLETFPLIQDRPEGVMTVEFQTDGPSFTSFCPITHQPDYYQVRIRFVPGLVGLESKSLKLYLETFRDRADFAEDLCRTIFGDLKAALNPKALEVSLIQNVRGGLTLKAENSLGFREPVLPEE